MNIPVWDDRYSEPGYAYGTEPNEFLATQTRKIPSGRILSLGEGEGRNAVFLAGLGFEVTAVDGSSVGLAKARDLAATRGLTITTVTADLKNFPIELESWEGIVSISCHLPSAIRAPLYRRAVAGLRPGGIFVLESYTPRQLQLGTGGPSDADMLSDLASLRCELDGLEFLHAVETERDVTEGRFHKGMAAVVQIVAVKR